MCGQMGKVFYDHFLSDLLFGQEVCALPRHVDYAVFQVWRALSLHLHGSSGPGRISLITIMTQSLRDLFFAAFHLRGLGEVTLPED